MGQNAFCAAKRWTALFPNGTPNAERFSLIEFI
jgi:hypothetical protein